MADLIYKEKIEIEMATTSYVILISSIFDTKKGFERLKSALIKIDSSLEYKKSNFKFYFLDSEKKYSINEALNKNISKISLDKAQNKVSGSYIYAYPPGIPLILPGEIINKDIIDQIKYLDMMGVDLSIDDFEIPIID